jgi:light-regulated signal transduction histidine kinase (bacteriophytochrome)
VRAEDWPLARTVRTGEAVHDHLAEIETFDGDRKWVVHSSEPVREPDGRLVGAIVISHDVTARRDAEKKLEERTRDLERSNAELSQFAYVASHDLQEPLRMVSSYTQLLSRRYRGKLDATADEFIDFAVDGAKRMQQLIEALLQYSRVGTHGQPFAPVDMNRVFAAAVANLRLAIEESGAVVEHGPLPTVAGDEVQLIQLLQNLIGNAIKFRGEETPRVRLDAVVTPLATTMTVADNGIGIDPQFAERIFGVFQRLHPRDRYPGAGIGLAVCRKIVARHDGDIRVDPRKEGPGSVFTFTLKASIARAAA